MSRLNKTNVEVEKRMSRLNKTNVEVKKRISRLNKTNLKVEKQRPFVNTSDKLNFDKKNAPYPPPTSFSCYCKRLHFVTLRYGCVTVDVVSHARRRDNIVYRFLHRTTLMSL